MHTMTYSPPLQHIVNEFERLRAAVDAKRRPDDSLEIHVTQNFQLFHEGDGVFYDGNFYSVFMGKRRYTGNTLRDAMSELGVFGAGRDDTEIRKVLSAFADYAQQEVDDLDWAFRLTMDGGYLDEEL